jgi:hypothetical protein
MATTAQLPLWVGSQEATETPDSPKIKVDATRFSVTRIYEGPYAVLSGNQPTQGQAFSDMPAACLVVDLSLEKLPGGKGRLTVTAETSGPSQATPFAPLYEIEWVEVDKKLEDAPIYSDGSDPLVHGGDIGAFALTISDRAAVQQWEDEADFKLKAQYMFKVQTDTDSNPLDGYTKSDDSPRTINGVQYDVYTLSTNAQNLAKKKLRGQDSYRVWAPVVRETIQAPSLPSTNPCGIIENPPDAADPPEGYVWQRSADRGTKTGRYGKWTEQREWQGADAIDTDLYTQAGT